jgi:hypothetical protein
MAKLFNYGLKTGFAKYLNPPKKIIVNFTVSTCENVYISVQNKTYLSLKLALFYQLYSPISNGNFPSTYLENSKLKIHNLKRVIPKRRRNQIASSRFKMHHTANSNAREKSLKIILKCNTKPIFRTPYNALSP